MTKLLLTFLISVAATGCGSTGVMQSGPDRYLISKSDNKVGLGPPTGAYASISEEAEAFCTGQSKKAEVINVAVTHPALGRLGSATIEFRCIPK